MNIAEDVFILHDMSSVPIEQVDELVFVCPPALALSLEDIGQPLKLDEIYKRKSVWVEALIIDSKLSAEPCGWYQLYGERLVQNNSVAAFIWDMRSKWRYHHRGRCQFG